MKKLIKKLFPTPKGKKNALPVGLVGKADRAEWESFNILLY